MAMNSRMVGSGEITLVLGHGYGGSQAIWDEVVPELSKRYKVLLFDWNFSGAVGQPVASGGSNMICSFEALADDLISLLTDWEMKAVVFVGHSLAGMVGCHASVKRPDLFRRLVLVAASPRYLTSKDYQGLEPSEVDNILKSIKMDFKGWAEGFARIILSTVDPIIMQKFSNSLKGMNPETALALAKMIFLSDQRHILEHVEVPCTIFQATNDAVVPLSVGTYIKSKVKGKAVVEIFENDGHFPHITSPKKFVEVLERSLLQGE